MDGQVDRRERHRERDRLSTDGQTDDRWLLDGQIDNRDIDKEMLIDTQQMDRQVTNWKEMDRQYIEKQQRLVDRQMGGWMDGWTDDRRQYTVRQMDRLIVKEGWAHVTVKAENSHDLPSANQSPRSARVQLGPSVKA